MTTKAGNSDLLGNRANAEFVINGGSLAATVLASELLMLGFRVVLKTGSPKTAVPSWTAVELGGTAVDNGFHALDVLRAPRLSHFLIFELGVDFSIDRRSTGVALDSTIEAMEKFNFSSGSSGADKAEVAARGLYGTVSELLENIPPEKMRLFQRLSSRYSDSWEAAQHLFVPWFLPATFTVKSDDEGDIVRNLIRLGVIREARIAPRISPFAAWGSAWMDWFHSHPQFSLLESKREDSSPQSEEAMRYFRLSLVRDEESAVHDFAEVLVADDKAPSIARLSSQNKHGTGLILVESFHSTSEEPPATEFLDQIQGLAGPHSHLLGTKVTRTIRKSNLHKTCPPVVVKDGRWTEVYFNSQGPLNMAKAQLLADRALSQLGIK